MLSTVEFSSTSSGYAGGVVSTYARAEGFEPSLAALETDVLTVNTMPACLFSWKEPPHLVLGPVWAAPAS